MKKYNIQNYIRYKEDVKTSIAKLEGKFYDEYTRDELIVKFLPLVEAMARKFSTANHASGVLSILDLLQIGGEALTKAVDKVNWEILEEKDDVEKSLKSFFSKRIKGAIRRRIDRHRGDIRIPEHKLNEMRSTKDKGMVQMFFNSIFLSIDKPVLNDEESMYHQIADNSEPYNIQLLNVYLKGLMQKHLKHQEYEVLRLSYGLDCNKHSAKEIAAILNIPGISNYVRVSEIKRQAVDRLINNVDHSQVLDYL
jgi:RNA polymerase sigma factor (sigma-70 family)